MAFTAEDATTLLALASLWDGTYEITVEDDSWHALCIPTGDILDAPSGPELRIRLSDYYRDNRRYLRPVVQENSASL